MINENDRFEIYINKISKYSSLINYYESNKSNPNSVKIISILKDKIKEVELFLLLNHEVNKIDSKLSSRYTDEEKIDYILSLPLERDISEEIHIIKILFNSEKFEKIDRFICEQPYNLV